MADSVARALVQKGSHAETSTNVRVVQFARATRPTSPVSPSPALAALVGASAGGLLGGLALLVRPRRKGGRGGHRPRHRHRPGPEPGRAAPAGVRVSAADTLREAARRGPHGPPPSPSAATRSSSRRWPATGRDLHGRCRTATPFQSHAWLSSWWLSYGIPGRLRVVLVRDAADGRLLAAAPLWLAPGPVPALVLLGGAITDYGDVLVDDDRP